MSFEEILDIMIKKDVSDIFIRANSNLKGRVCTQVQVIQEGMFSPSDTERIVKEITKESDRKKLKIHKACEFTYGYKEFWRFRVGIFFQRNTHSLVIRKIDLRIPTFEQLNLPSNVLEDFCKLNRGIVLLTGITGSGKSTTIASMMQYINANFNRHILTIEEPIEFTFQDNLSVVNQREIGVDVDSYQDALRQFALHSPDVIYVGNIRDAETCQAALTAAETGVLVFSTIHTINAASTIERIVNFFPPHQHSSIINQLSFLMKGVLAQRLLPRADRPGLIPAYEAMILSPTVARLIREKNFWEIPKYITAGDVYGMKSFHQCLIDLVSSGKVDPKTALEYADKKDELEMELRNQEFL